MNILSTHDLTKIYGNGDNEVHALSHVSLDIEEGTFVSIIGSSGSGKSTLLNLLGGLDRPTSGEVIVDGKSIFERFYRGKNAIEKEGVGIGLYLAREIIEKQGGCLSVHPAGQGNRFSIVLPKQLPDR